MTLTNLLLLVMVVIAGYIVTDSKQSKAVRIAVAIFAVSVIVGVIVCANVARATSEDLALVACHVDDRPDSECRALLAQLSSNKEK